MLDKEGNEHQAWALFSRAAQATAGMGRITTVDGPLPHPFAGTPLMPIRPSLVRSLVVVALGAALALSHIAFAAAQPQSADWRDRYHQDVEVTSAIAIRDEQPAENCYADVQAVKGVRGKTVLLRVQECD
jgi:hypothetical protein